VAGQPLTVGGTGWGQAAPGRLFPPPRCPRMDSLCPQHRGRLPSGQALYVWRGQRPTEIRPISATAAQG